ncbi:MAG: GEVED domain-containing protein [Bacteroidetes bacterium]|nr:GEVED domain-containing protein [Bacteroidota bacterium]
MKKIFSFLVLLILAFSVKSQTDYTIGTATGSNTNTSYACPIQDYFEGSRSQYLYLATELQAAGMTAGLINSIKFDVSALNNFSGTVEQYTISIGSSTVAALSSSSWETGTNPVYGPVDYTPVTGTNEFIFNAPFFWDGTSNIIIEICNGDPNSAAAGNTTWTGNPSSPWTTGLGFNAAHTYRADNVGYACGTTVTTQTGTLDTRPDATFSWVAATACSGTPLAGDAVSNKSNVCVNEAFYLSVTNGFLGTGLTYQWQDSSAATAGVWHNITGATNFSYSITTGISVNTCFRRKTTCTNGNATVFTKKVCLTVKPFYECYCNPLIGTTLYTNTTTLEINSVAIVGGAVNYSNQHTPTNPAPSLGYASFTGDTSLLQLKQGVAYTASVGTSITPTGGAMWVDWNHNNIFDSSEYTIIRYDAGLTTADAIIDVPANATLGLTMIRFRTASGAINYNNACTSYANGETEDYIAKIIPGTPCSGTPLGGTTKSTVDSICPNNPFTLSVENGTEGVTNLIYQWEYSTTSATGPWSIVSGATNKTYIAPTITTQMWFRRKITCGASGVYSTPITVNTKPVSNCYCGPNTGITLQSASSPWIQDIQFTDGTYDWTFTSCGTNVDNSTAGINRAYSVYDDTTCMARLTQASTYTMNVTQSAAPTQASVWIDFDHSGSFDASERQNLTVSGTTSTIDIAVPATAVVGITMMRVRIRAANIASACSQSGSGETEDYVIAIKAGVTCSGAPTPGNAISSVDSICKNTPFNLSVQNSTAGVIGLNYKWYKSTNGGSTWDSIPNTNTPGYTVPSITVNTCFRRGIKCQTGTEVFSTSVCVIVKSQFQCYCGPNTGIILHSSTSPSINDVTVLYSGSPIYNNASPGVPTGGYSIFDDTALAPRLTQGENYTLSIINSAAPTQAAVWIDWDQSGTFESSEILNITPTATGTGTISVPTTALTGFTMMRIRIRAAAFTDACETFGSGETEDYIIKVLPGVQCSGTPIGGTTNATTTTICKGLTFTVSVTGSSAVVGVLGFTYQWQDSTVGGNWANVTGLSTSTTYTTTLSTANRYFRRKITCANGNAFAYSAPVLVSLNTPAYATLPFGQMVVLVVLVVFLQIIGEQHHLQEIQVGEEMMMVLLQIGLILQMVLMCQQLLLVQNLLVYIQQVWLLMQVVI